MTSVRGCFAMSVQDDPSQMRGVDIIERTEENVRVLCDTQVPRFLGLYHIYDCQREMDSADACRPEALERPGPCDLQLAAIFGLATSP